MTDAGLYSLFRAASAQKDDRPALILEAGEVWTYGKLWQEAERMAAALAALGVEPGDRVLIQAEKSAAAAALYLGILQTGAVFVPLNTAYTARELDYFLRDAMPKAAILDPAAASSCEESVKDAGCAHLLTLDAGGDGSLAALAASLPPRTDRAPRTADDTACILYTSGTTGRSKGAMLSNGNLASNAKALMALWRFSPEDILIHALPVFHAHGLFVALHLTFLAGASAHFLAKFDAGRVLALIPRATVFMGVPTHYVRLLAMPSLTREHCAAMRLFVSGSAPLSAETHHAWTARTGRPILERYGMTEAGMIASNPYEGEQRIPGSVGFPLPGVRARIVGEEGRELPRGETGILEIRGPNVTEGYWNKPEQTAASFTTDGYFITGDLAIMDEGGRITLSGRASDMIITGGLNVYPKEVEDALDDIPGIVESAVAGVPHPDFGEAVIAAVIRENTILSEAEILAALSDKIAKFKQPKRIVFPDALPRNVMGKVEKTALRQRYGNLFNQAPDQALEDGASG